jgi:pyruvate kinase
MYSIFAKIETQKALENIDEITEVSDGLIIARGDLGVEIPVEKIPVIQKILIRKGKRVWYSCSNCYSNADFYDKLYYANKS